MSQQLVQHPSYDFDITITASREKNFSAHVPLSVAPKRIERSLAVGGCAKIIEFFSVPDRHQKVLLGESWLANERPEYHGLV